MLAYAIKFESRLNRKKGVVVVVVADTVLLLTQKSLFSSIQVLAIDRSEKSFNTTNFDRHQVTVWLRAKGWAN